MRPSVGRSNLARAWNVAVEVGDWGSWKSKSVEERLKGVTVPAREWTKVVDRFGSEPDRHMNFE